MDPIYAQAWNPIITYVSEHKDDIADFFMPAVKSTAISLLAGAATFELGCGLESIANHGTLLSGIGKFIAENDVCVSLFTGVFSSRYFINNIREKRNEKSRRTKQMLYNQSKDDYALMKNMEDSKK